MPETFEHDWFLIELLGPPTCAECEMREPHTHVSTHEILVPVTRRRALRIFIAEMRWELHNFRGGIHERYTEYRETVRTGGHHEYVD